MAEESVSKAERSFIDEELKPVVRNLRAIPLDDALIKAHLTSKLGAHPELAAKAIDECAKAAQRIIELTDPTAVVAQRTGWYSGARDGGSWAKLKDLHAKSGRWTEEDLLSLDKSSTRIVAALPAPGLPKSKSKGLVVGYVQSGKTASYTAVISKAADEGFKLFIVVAGLTERLRVQTQKRLTRELTALKKDHWITITSADYDFSAQHQDMQAAALLAPGNGHAVLGVIKKNSKRLDRLLAWLSTAKEQLRDYPVLIIDDEADEASINTAKQLATRSAINRRLVELITTLPRVSYVAYTATPFANLLIPPDKATYEAVKDLYPSEFIIDLPRPSSYVGAERVFGRGMLPAGASDSQDVDGIDVVRTIPDDDSVALRVPNQAVRHTFVPPATNSLKEAVSWFVLACAARLARGDGDAHMTMLVHTSQYTSQHENTRGMLQRLLSDVLASHGHNSSKLRELWDNECARAASISDSQPHAWADIEPHIPEVARKIDVYIENGLTKELDFDRGQVVGIVVGGNVLSRGLTIEGLMVSYFLRTSTTYDTLLQMGRWFGFRPNYLDLSRIWMTADLSRSFRDLALVEEEIRVDIRRYASEHLNPTQFAVRIRQHSSLLVTSRQKMRHAVQVKIGFSGREISTRVFYRSEQWLKSNWDAGASLLRRAKRYAIAPDSSGASRVYRGVPVEVLLEFLEEYQVHPDCLEFNSRYIADYIRHAINAEPARLTHWNVVVVQRAGTTTSTQLGDQLQVSLLNRTNYVIGNEDPTNSDNYLDIRALTSEGDAALDLSWDGTIQARYREAVLAKRSTELPDTGLLLLYPIDKDSAPTRPSDVRRVLNAGHHVLAAAIVFPGDTPGKKDATLLENDYISANLELLRDYGVEEEELEETDAGMVVATQ